MKAYLLGGCQAPAAFQWAVNQLQAHCTHRAPTDSLKVELLTRASLPYVVVKGIRPPGRLEVPFSFVKLYTSMPTALERQRLWEKYYDYRLACLSDEARGGGGGRGKKTPFEWVSSRCVAQVATQCQVLCADRVRGGVELASPMKSEDRRASGMTNMAGVESSTEPTLTTMRRKRRRKKNKVDDRADGSADMTAKSPDAMIAQDEENLKATRKRSLSFFYDHQRRSQDSLYPTVALGAAPEQRRHTRDGNATASGKGREEETTQSTGTGEAGELDVGDELQKCNSDEENFLSLMKGDNGHEHARTREGNHKPDQEEDDFLMQMEGKTSVSSTPKSEDALKKQEEKVPFQSIAHLLSGAPERELLKSIMDYVDAKRALGCQEGKRTALPPPLFYWEITLCGEQHFAYLPVPDTMLYGIGVPASDGQRNIAVINEKGREEGRGGSTQKENEKLMPGSIEQSMKRGYSIWIPLALLRHIDFRSRFAQFQQMLAPERALTSSLSYLMKESNNEFSGRLGEALGVGDALTHSVEDAPPNQVSGDSPSPSRRWRVMRRSYRTDPLTSFPYIFFLWRRAKSLRSSLPSPLLGDSLLSRSQAVYLMGFGYYVNVKETILGSLMDSSFCTQFRVPLKEDGTIFLEAISAVRAISIPPRNSVHHRGKLCSVSRLWGKRKKASDDSLVKQRRQSQFFSSRDLKAESPTAENVSSLSAAHGAVSGVEGENKESDALKTAEPTNQSVAAKELGGNGNATNIWFDKMIEMQSEAVLFGQHSAQQQRRSAELKERSVVPASAHAGASITSRYSGSMFLSPYWVAVDTLEKRWGVRLSQHPSVTFITVNHRKYVNAEHTTDASRFNALTCSPHRIHQFLGFYGVRNCCWELSEALEEAYKNQSARRDDSSSSETLPCGNVWVSLRLVREAGWEVHQKALLTHLDGYQFDYSSSASPAAQSPISRVARFSYFDARRGFGHYLSVVGSSTEEMEKRAAHSMNEEKDSTDYCDSEGSLRLLPRCFADPVFFRSFLTKVNSLPDTLVNIRDIKQKEEVLGVLSFAPCIILRSARYLLPPSLSAGTRNSGDDDHGTAGVRENGTPNSHASMGGPENNMMNRKQLSVYEMYMDHSCLLHTRLLPSSRILLALFALRCGYQTTMRATVPTSKADTPGSAWFSEGFLQDEPSVIVLKQSRSSPCAETSDDPMEALPEGVTVQMYSESFESSDGRRKVCSRYKKHVSKRGRDQNVTLYHRQQLRIDKEGDLLPPVW